MCMYNTVLHQPEIVLMLRVDIAIHCTHALPAAVVAPGLVSRSLQHHQLTACGPTISHVAVVRVAHSHYDCTYAGEASRSASGSAAGAGADGAADTNESFVDVDVLNEPCGDAVAVLGVMISSTFISGLSGLTWLTLYLPFSIVAIPRYMLITRPVSR